MNNWQKAEAKADRISSDELIPLELTKNFHICLWDQEGKYKWTVGYFEFEKEGPRFAFVGERPLDERVDWEHFRSLIKLGYALAWHAFDYPADTKK